MFEAHSDLEIFRIRLGKALDYEFHEDYIGGYFSEKGPRDVSSDFGVRLSRWSNRPQKYFQHSTREVIQEAAASKTQSNCVTACAMEPSTPSQEKPNLALLTSRTSLTENHSPRQPHC